MSDFQRVNAEKLAVDKSHASFGLVNYHISGIESREIAFARLRAKLISDYGIGLSHRFEDREENFLGSADLWKHKMPGSAINPPGKSDRKSNNKSTDKSSKAPGLGKGNKDEMENNEPEDIDRQIENSEIAELARKIETASRNQISSMEAFLALLRKEFGESFEYPKFNLSKYKNENSQVQLFAVEVAMAFSKLIVEDTRDLRKLGLAEQVLASAILSRKVLGLD